uniref:Uncharacterized protein n=1 Tax=Triticum urartu TaxID=4572 RepID=A0A8R7QG01_TRIUA
QLKTQRRRGGAAVVQPPPPLRAQDGAAPARERERARAAHHTERLLPRRLLAPGHLHAEAAGQPGRVERQVHRVERRHRRAALAREHEPRGRADGRRRDLRPRRHPVAEHQRARHPFVSVSRALLPPHGTRRGRMDVHRDIAEA